MNETKKSWWSLLNPLNWLAAIFSPLLRFLGLMPHPRTDGFENIQAADVDEAAEQAKRTEEAVDAIVRQMSPPEVVKAYAGANPEDRAVMDLSALDTDGVDWLLGLSDDELTLLAMSTTAGCARSLDARDVKPSYPKAKPKTETPAVLRTTSAVDREEENRQFIAARVRELFHAPGVPNLNPQYVPSATLH